MNHQRSLLAVFLISILAFLVGVGALAAPFRVAVVMPSSIQDVAFSQSMYGALVAIQQDMGEDNFQFVYSDNMFVVSDAAAAIRDYASQGYDLIIAHGSQYGSSLVEIAPDFPHSSFAWGTTVDTFVDQGIRTFSPTKHAPSRAVT